jgi:hypothetical protein
VDVELKEKTPVISDRAGKKAKESPMHLAIQVMLRVIAVVGILFAAFGFFGNSTAQVLLGIGVAAIATFEAGIISIVRAIRASK